MFLYMYKTKSPSNQLKIRMTIVKTNLLGVIVSMGKINFPIMQIEVLVNLLTSSLLSHGNWDMCIIYFYTSLNILYT